ncbi:MAG: BREX-6 system BrxE protein [Myxococcales bacterium]|nr:BREX-6 system BrxE protein [Myxococcales bacterium]
MAAAEAPPTTATHAELDAILAIQMTVAWAGELVAAEERLAWWRTELTDPEAGGDFLARLLPRTHAWASLAAAREAARRVDEAARRRSGTPDALWSLFHFGFAWDERLEARLGELRQGEALPGEALKWPLPLTERFDRAAFVAWLEGLARETSFEVVPGGRKLSRAPASRLEGARRLAAALAPLGPDYSLPFFARETP